jgi:PKD repeat protein
MKHRILTLTLLLTAITFAAEANPVDMNTAREVAMKFVNANTKTHLRGAEELQLVTTYSISRGDAAFHIFNTPNGFVIVSADDCATPILGYSDEGRPFDPDNVPVQLQDILHSYLEQIQYGIENHLIADENTVRQWELVQAMGRLNDNRDGEVVEPLITTQWDQWWPYNALCPEGAPTGCTATATAQIMNYWQYPTKGVGYHSYEPRSGLGVQSVWFNETYYQWDSMDENHVEAISTLMYHVGVAMDMQYNYLESGSQIYQAEKGVQKYFDYSDSSYYVSKGYISDSIWGELIKQNLLLSIPVLYAGYTQGRVTGHAWVLDGFDNNDLYHMNFGWSGSGDGYYNINNLSFNFDQEAVFNIHPSHSTLTSDFSFAPISSYLQYQFYDFSKGVPFTYKWFFGDGDSSVLQNPSHYFNQPGNYDVTLIVSNEVSSDTISKNIQIGGFAFFPTNDIFAPNDPILCPPLVFDYDMDGRQDIFVSGYLGQQLYHNDSSSFSGIALPFDFAVNAGPTMSIEDLEKTNRPSILSSAIKGFYLKNNFGVLDLSENELLSMIKDNVSFAFGDYDGDGDDDLLLDGMVYRNNGNGWFSKTSNNVYSAQRWIDYDGDGDLDLVGTAIYRNDGENGFNYVFSLENSPYVFFGLIDMADMDGNGKLDLVGGEIIAYNQNDTDFVRNDTSVVYTAHEYIYNDQTITTDINGDGFSDIIINRRGDCYVMLNESDSLLRVAIEPVSYNATSSLIDYDDDNVVDLFSSGPGGDNGIVFRSRLLKNSTQAVNNPPTTPLNLWTEVSGNSVILHWDTVSDDHSRYGSVTYNIMVGTTPNGFDIISPLSNVETGKRYSFDKGNVGHAPLWKLNSIPNGIYYWRVQAIDNSLAASQFSEIGTFVINGSNLPPELAEIYDTTFLNTHYSFSKEMFLQYYHDAEGDSLRYLMIYGLPGKGHMVFNGDLVEQGQVINIDAINNLYYETNSFYYDTDTILFKVSDGNSYSQPAPYYLALLSQNTAPIIHVVPDGNGDGSSWANAIGDLQYAINLASANHQDIWVSSGTFVGDSISHNAFTLDNVRIFGGFRGDEPSDYDLSEREILQHPTILDGQHSQRTVFGSGTIDGCVLQNGQNNSNFAEDYGANVKGVNINNSIIRNGECVCGGGAAYCRITNSILVDNSGYLGSAAYQCDMINCVLIGNFSWGYTTWWSTLTNCILWDNGGSNAESTISYSAIQDEMIDGEGNILLAHNNNGNAPDSLYVRFVDPENGDFRLAYGSACINAGTPDISELGLPSVDLQGNPRVIDGRIDMGAYEFSPTYCHFTTPGIWSEPSNWSDSTLPSTDAIVFIDAPCQLDQNASVAALTVSDGQSLTLLSGNTLTVTGTLVNADASGLVIKDGAQIIHSSEGVYATMEKDITGYTDDGGFCLLAVPFTDSVSVPEQMTGGEYDLYLFDQYYPNAEWRNHKADAFSLVRGQGYLYANSNDTTLTLTGQIPPSDEPFSVNLTYDANSINPGYNLVGNPFTCDAYIDRAYYVLNEDGSGINPVEVSASIPIPPCTSVVVKALDENDTVVFTKATH